jgi:hypothetical protein
MKMHNPNNAAIVAMAVSASAPGARIVGQLNVLSL